MLTDKNPPSSASSPSMNLVVNAAAIGFAGGKPIANRTIRKFNARRKVVAGYPWEEAFTVKDEIDQYLGGEMIICLLCGKPFKKLGCHLLKIHAVSGDVYREKYGLPWRTGLACLPIRERDAAATRERMNIEAMRDWAAKGRAKQLERPPRHRHKCPAIIKESTERILGVDRQRLYEEDVFNEFIARIRTGRSPKSVSSDADMPMRTSVHHRCAQNSAFAAAYRDAVDALPFSVQAQCEMLGPRFELELRRLFDQGYSDHQAAKALGVTAMTSNRRTKKWRADGGKTIGRGCGEGQL